MVTGLVFGVALLVSSTGVSPVPETPHAVIAPAACPERSRGAANFNVPFHPDPVRQEPRWTRDAAPRAQPTKPKKFSPTDRVIAVAAGVAVGWVVGGAIGYKATARSHPYDDGTSGLRGVVIGAPIGGAAGGILGYWATNR
jgi:hypothetical protein